MPKSEGPSSFWLPIRICTYIHTHIHTHVHTAHMCVCVSVCVYGERRNPSHYVANMGDCTNIFIFQIYITFLCNYYMNINKYVSYLFLWKVIILKKIICLGGEKLIFSFTCLKKVVCSSKIKMTWTFEPLEKNKKYFL